MKKLNVICALLIVMAVLSVYSCYASGQAVLAEMEYEIFSDKKKIGDIMINISEAVHQDEPVRKIEVNTVIKVKYLAFFTYKIESSEVYLKDQNGVILFESHSDLDGTKVDVTGRSLADRFSFEITSEGEKSEVSFENGEYDSTSIDNADSLLENVGDRKTLKILDFDELAVKEQVIEWVGFEDATVMDTTVTCRKINFTDEKSHGFRLITNDGDYIMIREEGEDEGKKYSVVLRTITADGK